MADLETRLHGLFLNRQHLDHPASNVVAQPPYHVTCRILEGDHIPSGGQNAAQAQLTNEAGEIKEYDYAYYDDTIPDSPFVNPFDSSHQNQQFLMAGDLAGHLAQRVFTTTQAPILVPGAPTTPEPKKFFPPGQIKLDRFPAGFNFQFQSQK